MIMKNVYCVLFLWILCLNFLHAQTQTDYHAFLKEGKVWNCSLVEHISDASGSGQQTTYYRIQLSGDTIVNGHTYKKMYDIPSLIVKQYGDGSKDSLVIEGEMNMRQELLREESYKVYIYPSFIGGEDVLYDFSAVAGAITDICTIPTEILSIDTVNVNRQRFRRYHVKPDIVNDEYDCVWIEGVGHPGGPTRVWGAEVNDGRIYRLLSCYEDGKCIFTDGDFYKAGETDCINHVNKKPLTVHSSTYDLQGRPILRSFKYGVFIQNGKKVVR